MKKTIVPAIILSGLLLAFSGCGSDSDSSGGSSIDLPDGKTMIFFDNKSARQYSYNTDTEIAEDMNTESNATFNMTGKTGTLFSWLDETPQGDEQKIVMFHDSYDFAVDGNATFEDFHYLGHFHEEDNVKHFAAHSNSEFDPAVSSDAKKAAMVRLNTALAEREEIKEELSEVLPDGEVLCNFFVFDHDHHDEEDDNATEEEAIPHIALSGSGKVYVYGESNETLTSSQPVFALDGVSECKEAESAIIQSSDDGVFIFSANSQKLYLVDNHGMDFHQHSSWNIGKFLPEGFTPTGVAAIGEGEADHDH